MLSVKYELLLVLDDNEVSILHRFREIAICLSTSCHRQLARRVIAERQVESFHCNTTQQRVTERQTYKQKAMTALQHGARDSGGVRTKLMQSKVCFGTTVEAVFKGKLTSVMSVPSESVYFLVVVLVRVVTPSVQAPSPAAAPVMCDCTLRWSS